MPLHDTPTKTCEICGATYTVKASRREKSRYCSMPCKHIGQSRVMTKPMVQCVCAQCGNGFEVKPKTAKTQRYCSRECADAGRTGRRLRPVHIRACETCGKSFEITKRESQRFCSSACYGVSQRGKEYPNATYRYIDRRHGYVYFYRPDHPLANKHGHVAEHRIVAECKIGRPLRSGEVVHHVNGDGSDNRAENLQVMTQAEHARLHSTGKSYGRIDRWAKAYDACVDCGTSQHPHVAQGCCERCYRRRRRAA